MTSILFGVSLALGGSPPTCPPITNPGRWPLLTSIDEARGKNPPIGRMVVRGGPGGGCVNASAGATVAAASVVTAVERLVEYFWHLDPTLTPLADIPHLRVEVDDDDNWDPDGREATAGAGKGRIVVSIECKRTGCPEAILVHELVHAAAQGHLSPLDGGRGWDVVHPERRRELAIQRGMAEALADFLAIRATGGADWWFPAPPTRVRRATECWRLQRNLLDPRLGCNEAPSDWYAAMELSWTSYTAPSVRAGAKQTEFDPAYERVRPVMARLLARLWEDGTADERQSLERFATHIVLGDPALLGRTCAPDAGTPCERAPGVLHAAGTGEEHWTLGAFCRVAAARLSYGARVTQTCMEMGIGSRETPAPGPGTFHVSATELTWSDTTVRELHAWRAGARAAETVGYELIPASAGFTVTEAPLQFGSTVRTLQIAPTRDALQQEDATLKIMAKGAEVLVRLRVRPAPCAPGRVTTSLHQGFFDTNGVDVHRDSFVEAELKRRRLHGCLPVSIAVDAHADWRGTISENLDLASARAEHAVLVWLSDLGLPRPPDARFQAWGETWATQRTWDPWSLQADRRADVVIGWVVAPVAEHSGTP